MADKRAQIKSGVFVGNGSKITIEGEEGNLKDVLNRKLNKSGGDITGALTIAGGLGVGKADPNALLDVRGNVNIDGDINVNNKRLSNYNGFPTADYSKIGAVVINQEYTFTHNFGSLPSLVQV